MNLTRDQAGISLMETMVAIIVISVGLIGVASLMLTNMRNNDVTLARAQSTMLAKEIYEKMLTNLPAVEAGHYNIAMAAALPQSTDLDCANATANCSPAEIAAWDLAIWGARATRILPQADAAINVDVPVDPETPMSIRIDLSYYGSEAVSEPFTFWAR